MIRLMKGRNIQQMCKGTRCNALHLKNASVFSPIMQGAVHSVTRLRLDCVRPQKGPGADTFPACGRAWGG